MCFLRHSIFSAMVTCRVTQKQIVNINNIAQCELRQQAAAVFKLRLDQVPFCEER